MAGKNGYTKGAMRKITRMTAERVNFSRSRAALHGFGSMAGNVEIKVLSMFGGTCYTAAQVDGGRAEAPLSRSDKHRPRFFSLSLALVSRLVARSAPHSGPSSLCEARCGTVLHAYLFFIGALYILGNCLCSRDWDRASVFLL